MIATTVFLAGLTLLASIITSARTRSARAENRVWTRDALDERDAHPVRLWVPVALLFAFVTWLTTWWFTTARAQLASALLFARRVQLWYELVATSDEKTLAWLAIGCAAFLLLLVLALWLALGRKLAWPDLYRFNPHDYPSGKGEWVGRIKRTIRYTTHTREATVTRARLVLFPWPHRVVTSEKTVVPSEATHARVYYKHAGRGWPYFFYDTLDVPLAQQPYRINPLAARVPCARIEWAPDLGRRRHRPAPAPYGSHAPLTTFRDQDEQDDKRRTSSIVLTGAMHNVEIAQQKARREATISEFESNVFDAQDEDDITHPEARA